MPGRITGQRLALPIGRRGFHALPRVWRALASPICLVLSACLALVALPAGSHAQEWRAAALASFDEAWQTISDTFYDPTFGGQDWARVRAELRPAAENASSPAEARAAIEQMLERLHQSHFELLAAQPGLAYAGDAIVPIEVRAISDGMFITRVEPDSTAARAGLQPGDRLVAIDGEAADGWRAAEAGRTDPRALQLAVWRRAVRALHGASGSRARVTVMNAAGRQVTLDVARVAETGETVTVGNLPPMHVSERTSGARTPAGRRAGVIAFNVWMTAVAVPLADGVDTYRDADGLVFDLRGNPGGLADMIRGVAGQVMDEPALLGRIHMRGVELELRANPRRSMPDGRRVAPFAGPVAILVDELTASASECFAGGLQSLGRARVFGVRTMGQALPASTRKLPNGDVLMYGVGDFVTSTGQRLEGEGVVPDEAVPTTVSGLRSGRDAALDAALAWLDRSAATPR